MHAVLYITVLILCLFGFNCLEISCGKLDEINGYGTKFSLEVICFQAQKKAKLLSGIHSGSIIYDILKVV